MSHSILNSKDQMGAIEAVDALNQSAQILSRIIESVQKQNEFTARGEIEKGQALEKTQSMDMAELEKKLHIYISILFSFGREHSSMSHENNDIALIGFDILNEASGLKLSLKLQQFREKLQFLLDLYDLNQNLLDDRMQFLSLVLDSLRGKDQHLVYNPADNGNGTKSNMPFAFNSTA